MSLQHCCPINKNTSFTNTVHLWQTFHHPLVMLLIGFHCTITLEWQMTHTCTFCYKWKNITWSYSEDPGYSGHPKNNSAITHPRDHISIASENGKPRITSGALKKKDTNCYCWYMYIGWLPETTHMHPMEGRITKGMGVGGGGNWGLKKWGMSNMDIFWTLDVIK